jgi:hypothetical protein
LKAVTHASEAIHGTHTRAPFSPLQKSHTLKKARIKEGLFIGPMTCPLLSNTTWKSAFNQYARICQCFLAHVSGSDGI